MPDNSEPECRRFAILYVDDEEKSLQYFEEAFEDDFIIHTAPNTAKAMEILDANSESIGVILSDQRMPGETGVEFFEKARAKYPDILRILVTAFADLENAIDAVNSGAVYLYLTKPWNLEQLEITLKRSLHYFIVQQERNSLLRQKYSTLRDMMAADRVASVGILSSGLNHHMRNALTAINTFIELIPIKQEEEEGGHPRDEYFWTDYRKEVVSQIARITTILNGLWESSQYTRKEFPDVASYSELVRETADLFTQQYASKKIDLELTTCDVPQARMDIGQIRQLFRMLLEEEHANVQSGGFVKIGTAFQDEQVVITITDNGPHYPDGTIRNVFDPFFLRTDNPSQIGINLMACYLIAYHHGGQMSVANNESGVGSSVVAHLPLDPTKGKENREPTDVLKRIMENEVAWEDLRSQSHLKVDA